MSFKNAHLPIQRTILNYANNGYVSGVLRAILAAARVNNTISARDLGGEGGKLRDFRISYVPPICEADGDCNANICASGITVAPKQVVYQLKNCTASPVVTIKMKDMRDLENIGADAYSMQLIANLLVTVRENLAKDVAAILAANQGCQLDGNPTKQVSIVSPVNGSLNPLGIATINKQFQDAKLTGVSPFIVGSDAVYFGQQAIGLGGNNFLGQEIGRVQMPNAFYDPLINQQYADGNHIWAFDPSVFKFISFNENAGRFATDLTNFEPERMFSSGPNWYSGTMLDPLTGILWDLDGYYDICAKAWNFQFKLHWDIFFLPQRVCNIECFNGLLHFTTCEMLPVECPAVTPTPANVPVDYCVTPPATCYPKFINDVVIGNQSYAPAVNIANIADLAAMLNGLGAYQFTVDGTQLKYTGYSPITIVMNGNITLTFAECE